MHSSFNKRIKPNFLPSVSQITVHTDLLKQWTYHTFPGNLHYAYSIIQGWKEGTARLCPALARVTVVAVAGVCNSVFLHEKRSWKSSTRLVNSVVAASQDLGSAWKPRGSTSTALSQSQPANVALECPGQGRLDTSRAYSNLHQCPKGKVWGNKWWITKYILAFSWQQHQEPEGCFLG